MTRKNRAFILAAVIAINTIYSWSAAYGQDRSVYDKIWGYATLFEKEDSHYIRKLALSGRLQTDSAWFDADQGDFNDNFLWRRFRFGFKAELFRSWVLHVEGDFDLNQPVENTYQRITDAYIGWAPTENLNLKLLKQSAGFTLDGATSSKKLLTMQRNNLTNNLWFVAEYFTGFTAKGKFGDVWSYTAGIYSSDGSTELSTFDAAYFTLFSVGYQIRNFPDQGNGLIRVDYVYNVEDTNSNTRDFSHVLSIVTQWESGSWGFRSDLSAGDGYASQSNVWGVVLMPYYFFHPRIQAVFRYTFIDSKENNGVRLSRYEDRIIVGRGNAYNEFYIGVNVFFYGQKLMWQTGLEHASMNDDALDGGRYEGLGLSTGLRVYW